MPAIVNSSKAPHLLPRFRAWVESEWGNVDPFTSTAEALIVPAPILAVEQDQLLGGLSFTDHALPDSKESGVWINTLLVAAQFRNRGIGASLIKAAEAEAARLGIGELFVFTEIPRFYEKLGWTRVKRVDDNTVLRRLLSG